MQKSYTMKEQRKCKKKMFKCKKVGPQESGKKTTKRVTIRLNQRQGCFREKISIWRYYV